MKSARDCVSMEDIRQEIDRIDEALMRLMAERWSFINRAAEIKVEAGLPADIPARVDEVRANVRAHAQALGLDPAFYDALWAQIIRHSIRFEDGVLGTENNQDAATQGTA